jgi:hypothetical protein
MMKSQFTKEIALKRLIQDGTIVCIGPANSSAYADADGRPMPSVHHL